MKKFTGRYTTNTAKALKGSERILCQVSEDGTIYICNGFLLCTMNAPEYAATVQPLTCCEPGAWTFGKDGKHEDEAHKLDLVKLFADTVRDTADAAPLGRGGRPDRHHQRRNDRRAGGLARRRHKAPRKRDRGRRRQVEWQEERLLFPRRLIQNPSRNGPPGPSAENGRSALMMAGPNTKRGGTPNEERADHPRSFPHKNARFRWLRDHVPGRRS